MASKVNVKFVVLLTAALAVLVVGVAAVGYTVVYKSPAELEELGDKAMAAGDDQTARAMYSKAVNKDQRNVRLLEKWLGAIERLKPETEVEFLTAYQGNYTVVRFALADAQPTNVEAQDGLLSLLRRQFLATGYSRRAADGLIEQVNRRIEPFESAAGADPAWRRLLRYRGLAVDDIWGYGGALEPEQIETAIADLRAAVEADPGDGESLATLIRLYSRQAGEQLAVDRTDRADALYAQAMQAGDDFLANDPDDVWAVLFRGLVEFDRERARRTHDLLPDEAARIIREMLPRFLPQFERAIAAARASEQEIDPRLLMTFARFEEGVDPGASRPRTLALAEELVAKRPEDGTLLLTVAQLYEESGDYAKTLEYLERTAALPDTTMSLEGFLRFPQRRQALMGQVDVLLRQYIEGSDLPEEQRRPLLTRAEEVRAAYAAQALADDPRLLFVDGLHAIAVDDIAEALRLFSRYNEQTSNSDPRGLWREGQTALRLNQDGIAERAYERLTTMQSSNLNAVIALAETKTRLQKNAEALAYFQRALELSPGNEAIRERMALIAAVDNPAAATDPVVRAILESRRVRLGNETTPASPLEADRILEAAFAQHAGDDRLTRELVVTRLDRSDLVGARAAAARALAAKPDSAELALLAEALNRGSVVEAMSWLVDQSDRPPVDKLLSKHAIYTSNGLIAEADAVLADAAALAPEEPRVFEAVFMKAIRDGRLEDLDPMVARASELDLDRMGGLTFRSRALAARGRYLDAITAIQQAISRGAAPPAAYRLMAAQQRAVGRLNDAIATLEQGLGVKPDDVRMIAEYVDTLRVSGRADEALDAARRMERYGRGDAEFTDLWLGLESTVGGRSGRRLAIERRNQKMLANPADRLNVVRLAALHMDEREWARARELIDQLSAEREDLASVELLARWYADQGRVEVNGELRNGMELARSAFTDFIIAYPDEGESITTWMSLAGFLANYGDVEGAARALEEGRAFQDPTELRADKMLGDLLLSRGRFEGAREAYRRVIDANADDQNQSYLQRLIEATLRLNDFQGSQGLLAQLREPQASSLGTLLQMAETERGLGNLARSRELLDRAVAEHPTEPLPFTLRARAADSRGDTADALADLDNALKLNPGFARALRLRAGLYFKQGRVEDAIRDMRAIVDVDPTQNDVAFTLIHELNRLGRDRDAMTIVEQIVEKRPTDSDLIANFAVVFSQHDRWDRASGLFDLAWQRGRNPAAAVRLIESLLRQSPPGLERARAVLGEIRSTIPNPDQVSTLSSLQAAINFAAGDVPGAEQAMTRSYELTRELPQNVLSWNGNVTLVFRDRPEEEIVAFLRRLRAQQPEGNPANRWLDLCIAQRTAAQDATRARGLVELAAIREGSADDVPTRIAFRSEGGARYAGGDYQGARRVWTEGARAFPDDWEIANNLAFLLADELGNPEEALPFAQKAAELAPREPSVLDTLATVYRELGRLDEADATLDQAEALQGPPKVQVDVLLNRARLALARDRRDLARSLLVDAQSLVSGLGPVRNDYQATIDSLLNEVNTPDD